MKGFHTQRNLFFERLPNGGVKITKYPDDTNWLAGDDAPSNPPLFVQELDAGTWCSVIASMSAGGEQDDRFYLAKNFHESVGRRFSRRHWRLTSKSASRTTSWSLPRLVLGRSQVTN